MRILRPKHLGFPRPSFPGTGPALQTTVAVERIERKRRAAERSRDGEDKHHYFSCIAETRFVLRKVFRILEDQAKAFDLEPLEHLALLQIYGSEKMELKISEIAERLDITPPFASVLVKTLQQRRLVSRVQSKTDRRVMHVTVTTKGRSLLHAIDERVKGHVDYFSSQLTGDQKERAVAILLFYVGLTVAGKTDRAQER